MAVVVWAELVMTCLRGWSLQSAATWLELMGYRLDKAYQCKFTNTRNEHDEHEFVIYEFTNKRKNKLELRTDRAVVERNERKDVPLPLSVRSFIHVGGSPLIRSLFPSHASRRSPFLRQMKRTRRCALLYQRNSDFYRPAFVPIHVSPWIWFFGSKVTPPTVRY